MNNQIDFTSEQILPSHKRKYHSLLSQFKSRSRLYRSLIISLAIIIFILIILIISSLYALLDTLIKAPLLSSKMSQLSHTSSVQNKTIASINKKFLNNALKTVSLKLKTRKIDSITSIMSYQITHLKHKTSPYHIHFRAVLTQSHLLRGIEDVNQLYSWFPSGGMDLGDIYMELMYRGSRDGDDLSTFHFKCDDSQANVALIKTKKTEESPESFLLGGFSTVPITSNRSSSWVNTGLTYIFSLDALVKYKNERVFNGYSPGYNVILSYDNGIILYDKYLGNAQRVFVDVPRQKVGSEKVKPFVGKYYFVEDVEVFKVYINKLQ